MHPHSYHKNSRYNISHSNSDELSKIKELRQKIESKLSLSTGITSSN